MKRSVNFSWTKARRSYMLDTALFLRDLGIPDDGIKAVVAEMHTGTDDDKQTAIKNLEESQPTQEATA